MNDVVKCRPFVVSATCKAEAAPAPTSMSPATKWRQHRESAFARGAREARVQSEQRLLCTVGSASRWFATWSRPSCCHGGNMRVLDTGSGVASSSRKCGTDMQETGERPVARRKAALQRPTRRPCRSRLPVRQAAELKDYAAATRVPDTPSRNRAAASRLRPRLGRRQVLPAVAIAPRAASPRWPAPTD